MESGNIQFLIKKNLYKKYLYEEIKKELKKKKKALTSGLDILNLPSKNYLVKFLKVVSP